MSLRGIGALSMPFSQHLDMLTVFRSSQDSKTAHHEMPIIQDKHKHLRMVSEQLELTFLRWWRFKIWKDSESLLGLRVAKFGSVAFRRLHCRHLNSYVLLTSLQ